MDSPWPSQRLPLRGCREASWAFPVRSEACWVALAFLKDVLNEITIFAVLGWPQEEQNGDFVVTLLTSVSKHGFEFC